YFPFYTITTTLHTLPHQTRCTTTDASLEIPPPLPISVPTSSPSFLLPSASHREDRPEVTLPPRKRLGIALGPRYEVGESSSAAARPAGCLRADYIFVSTMDREIRHDPEREVGYGITDSWDEIVETLKGAPVSTDTKLGRHMTAFETRVRQDTDEIYMRWRQRLDCLERLRGDRWMRAVTSERLKANHRRSAEMRELRTADHTRQPRLIQTLILMQSLQGHVTILQGQAMIDQGVTPALAARDANRNGDDSHTSRTSGRRTERVVRECTYQDFMKLKGTDVIGYNQRFQELALLCVRMFPEESDKIERYIGGLPDMIHGNIIASKPKTMQEAVEMATELMDKKVSTIVERQVENKRKFKNTSRNNQNQQQQNKRQNTGRAYTAGTSEKKPYGGSKTLCTKCNYHHDGPCAPKCHKCIKFGHFAFQGHFKRECPKLKNNKNHGNQVGNDRDPAKVYAVGHTGTNPDSNVVTGTFLLNNHYASILFDTSVDRSFLSTAFSSQMDITPSTLDHYYDVN
ncbi:hypothetical protein Tco_1421544, partial [Tanacetum coccineum]